MKKMTLQVELSEDGTATISAEGFSLTTREDSPGDALHEATPIIDAVFPILAKDPCDLNIGPVEDDGYRGYMARTDAPLRRNTCIEKTVAVSPDGKLDYVKRALTETRPLRIDYTDSVGNKTEGRTIYPVKLDWGGGTLSPERVVKAHDSTPEGTVKTFYLSRVERVELL